MSDGLSKPFDGVELRLACWYLHDQTVRDLGGERRNSRRTMEYRPRARGGYFWFGRNAINDAAEAAQ